MRDINIYLIRHSLSLYKVGFEYFIYIKNHLRRVFKNVFVRVHVSLIGS